jgi:ethanolamine-phosphate phospho-lyase
MKENALQHKQIKEVVKRVFELTPIRLEPLHGYDNKNYLLTTAEGQWIVKTYNATSILPLLEEESRILELLEVPIKTPVPKKSINNKYVEAFEYQGENSLIRVLSFVEGTFFDAVQETHEALYFSLGSAVANLSSALSKLQSPLIQTRLWDWNLNATAAIQAKTIQLPTGAIQRTVRYFIQQFEQRVLPQLHRLPQQLLHNDLNECNLLVKNQKISGCIDFGDIAYGPRCYELAIALVYAAYDKEDYLFWSAKVLEGYAQHIDLDSTEIEQLYYIIAMRMCLSLCNAAEAKALQPENSYALHSEKKMEKMLLEWMAIGPIKVTNVFSEACGKKTKVPASLDTLVQQRARFLGGGLSLSYQRPVHIKAAALQYMYCADGTTLLDAYNNIPHLGHNHPKVVAAAQQQLATLNTNTRYIYDELHQYASHLLSYFPKELCRVYFVNSGSEASDLAIRMARAHTKAQRIAVVEHGYHGHTQTGIEISAYKFNHPKGLGKAEHILRLPLISKEEAFQDTPEWQKATQELSETPLAAFISETILGCAGQVPLAKGYLKKVYQQVRAKGGVCIADEVQTGFGRTGTHFWAFQQQDVVPDMVVLGKPMGNGHPMGAVVCTESISESFAKGVEFFSSFGGNPVSCAIGKAVLEVIEEEKLQQEALTTGNYYIQKLNALKEKYDCISEVRGSGLFLGLALTNENQHPHTALAAYLKNYLREKHILISTDGPYESVLKTKPPLCFSKTNVDEVVTQLELGLGAFYASLKR